MGVGTATSLSERRMKMDIFWLFFMLSALQPIIKQKLLEASRKRMIALIERERKSRVGLLVHRQETMSLLGFPIFRYIDINDSEEVLRAIHLTDPEIPIDLVLHTPGGLVLAATQMRDEVGELLADRYPSEKAEEIAKPMTSGTWTHDYPITCDRAQALGLPVNSNISENVLQLMELYPQPMRRQPSVEYVPVPYRSDRHPAPK